MYEVGVMANEAVDDADEVMDCLLKFIRLLQRWLCKQRFSPLMMLINRLVSNIYDPVDFTLGDDGDGEVEMVKKELLGLKGSRQKKSIKKNQSKGFRKVLAHPTPPAIAAIALPTSCLHCS
jgi:hypothetical protein